MSHSRNYRTVESLYNAYAEGNLESFYKDLSPDLVWIECDGFPTPGVFRNKEEVTDNVFRVLERDWSSWQYELEQLIDAGDSVVAVGSYQGTHGSTAKSFNARAAHVWQLVDGKIVRFEQFADTHPMQSAAVA